jgi:hypothetical protein
MTDRYEEFARYIEALPHTDHFAESGFNMADAVHECGSPCCLGGHARALTGLYQIPLDEATDRYLGCGYETAYALCFPEGQIYWEDITPAQAGEAIRRAGRGAPADKLWEHVK